MPSPGKQFYSNGKLLITGEYVVLYGAESLAFPTIYGQELKIAEGQEKNLIKWEAFEKDQLWFEAVFHSGNFSVLQSSDLDKARFLQEILRSAFSQSRKSLDFSKGCLIRTQTNFPINWGLGTSSTLINNIAQWLNINPFELSFSVSKGSGYDIACASAETPILYRNEKPDKPVVTPIEFCKSFLPNIYFVFSGKKMPTRNHVERFVNQNKDLSKQVAQISGITSKVIKTDELTEFIELIKEHESILSSVLKEDEIQHKFFMNFDGVIKSLGAWGGDFLLAATSLNESYVRPYFEQFGLSTIIPFNKMIKH